MRRLLLLVALLVGLPSLGWAVQNTDSSHLIRNTENYKVWQAFRCDVSNLISASDPVVGGVVCANAMWGAPLACGEFSKWTLTLINLSASLTQASVFGCYDVMGAPGHPTNSHGTQADVDIVGTNDPAVILSTDTTAGSACTKLTGTDDDGSTAVVEVNLTTADFDSVLSDSWSHKYPWYIVRVDGCTSCESILYFSCGK